ncbi:MAG: hypothetical protein R3213_06590, partial [Flavobacteriaceae bacterium]|nr:hypothetical protein [Flavobacteriaceae bacterium]
ILDEVVVIADDGWTREEKIEEFRKHYLGESVNGKTSKVMNEEDLILHFDKTKNQLRASTKAPILIKNRSLKYDIIVDLKEFEINYNFVSKNKKRLDVNYVYYSGSNFFKSLQEQPTVRTIAKRNEAYKTSLLHFMRSLAQEELRDNGYRVYMGNKLVPTKRFISVVPVGEGNGVWVRSPERVNLMDEFGNQSSIESFVDEFFVDHYGNHSFPEQVRFGGYLGSLRMGDALPLDFVSKDLEKGKI